MYWCLCRRTGLSSPSNVKAELPPTTRVRALIAEKARKTATFRHATAVSSSALFARRRCGSVPVTVNRNWADGPRKEGGRRGCCAAPTGTGRGRERELALDRLQTPPTSPPPAVVRMRLGARALRQRSPWIPRRGAEAGERASSPAPHDLAPGSATRNKRL